MYIVYAIISAIFSGLTSVFAKTGIKKIDSLIAIFIRTIIIFIFLIVVVIINGNISYIFRLNKEAYIIIIMSGLTNAILWLCYFRALSLSTISKVTPIDKTSIILTLLLSYLFFNEKITYIKLISIMIILLGTFLVVKKDTKKEENNKWIIYAILTSIFTSLTTIISKIGLKNYDIYIIILLRISVVLFILFIFIIIKSKYKNIKKLTKRNLLFIILSGISTAISWMFYYKSLKVGETTIVFSLEKLSIVVSISLSSIFLKDKINKKQLFGIILLLLGNLLIIIK